MAILSEGFRDSTGSYVLANVTLTGVFISDEPLDGHEGSTDEDLLAIELDDGEDPSPFELVEDLKKYREWCAPSRLLNARGTVRRVSPEEEDRLWLARWRDG